MDLLFPENMQTGEQMRATYSPAQLCVATVAVGKRMNWNERVRAGGNRSGGPVGFLTNKFRGSRRRASMDRCRAERDRSRSGSHGSGPARQRIPARCFPRRALRIRQRLLREIL